MMYGIDQKERIETFCGRFAFEKWRTERKENGFRSVIIILQRPYTVLTGQES